MFMFTEFGSQNCAEPYYASPRSNEQINMKKLNVDLTSKKK